MLITPTQEMPACDRCAAFLYYPFSETQVIPCADCGLELCRECFEDHLVDCLRGVNAPTPNFDR
jgi:hypothetical protein